MNNVGRVFITQESGSLNYSNAEAFGDVVFLTAREPSPVASSIINASIIDELRGKLATFDPVVDYIAPSGSPVVSGMAFLLLSERLAKVNARKISVLRWSNRDKVYQPITFQLQP
ncbi:MAG: hypothetical protein DDT26_00003 [Dehalococcoidia bacterium]|nr:hypothetical protein [Chloroflexota bacterium]